MIIKSRVRRLSALLWDFLLSSEGHGHTKCSELDELRSSQTHLFMHGSLFSNVVKN